MSAGPRLLLVTAALVALVTWTDFALRSFLPALNSAHWAGSGYWVAARLAIEGRTAILYDDAAFGQAAVALGTTSDIFGSNAPAMLLPILPLGLLSESTAHDVWLWLTVGALLLGWAWLVRALEVPLAPAIALTALLPLFQPLRHHLHWGQAYVFLLLLLVAAAAWSARRPMPARGPAALALGAAGVVKLFYGVALLLPPLVMRRWRVVAGALAVLGTAVAATMLLWGMDPWLQWLGEAVAWRARPETAVTAYQSLNGLLMQLLASDARWNPVPAIDARWLVAPIWFGACVALAAVTALLIRRTDPAERGTHAQALTPFVLMLSFALTVPVAVLASPIAEDYHFVLMLLPLLVAARGVGPLRSPLPWAVLALAAVLLGGPWPFNVAEVEGWRALLHYPRLYGALLLWALLAGLAWREGRRA